MMHLLCGRHVKDGKFRDIPMDTQKVVRRIGKRGRSKGQFYNPCGVAVSKDGDIVVADTENHRIQIFSENGNFKTKFGSKGSKPDQVNYPMCVAMTAEDHVAVTDSVNACLKVFSLEGQLVQMYGGSDVFDIPYGLAISHEGHYVVTDICKHCVTVLNPDGTTKTTFGEYGSESREFDHPYFVAIDRNKQIIVCDSGNTSVKMFTFEGKILRTFMQNDFKLLNETFLSLQGICIDTDGNVIIVCNSTIYIMTKSGRLWEVINPADGLWSPRCVAYSSAGRLIVTQNDMGKRHELCIFQYNKEDFQSLSSMQFYAISI